MSGDVNICQEMSRDVKTCQNMSEDDKKWKENISEYYEIQFQ